MTTDAYERGFQACMAGVKMDQCKHEANLLDLLQWREGWTDADHRIFDRGNNRISGAVSAEAR